MFATLRRPKWLQSGRTQFSSELNNSEDRINSFNRITGECRHPTIPFDIQPQMAQSNHMPDAFHELLDATLRHVQDLKARGNQFLSVRPETLQALTARPVTPPVGSVGSARDEPASSPPARPSALEALRARALKCVRCPHLVRSRKQVVFGVGNPNADLMFVGEAPGADEDAQGEPFVGRAGQLLTRIIETMGLSRKTVYIGNILKCRPDMPDGAPGNRKPTAEEMETCSPWLLEQIELIQPKVLVALGGTAVEGLLGGKVAITRARGQWTTFKGIPLMPTFHPSYLLRGNDVSKKRLVWEDMLEVMEKLGMPITEKQQAYFKGK